MITAEEFNELQFPKYEMFQGRYIDAMPALIASGRIPMNTKQIAKRRLEVLSSGDHKLIDAWWTNYFDTSDAISYFKNEAKVITNCEPLINI